MEASAYATDCMCMCMLPVGVVQLLARSYAQVLRMPTALPMSFVFSSTTVPLSVPTLVSIVPAVKTKRSTGRVRWQSF